MELMKSGLIPVVGFGHSSCRRRARRCWLPTTPCQELPSMIIMGTRLEKKQRDDREVSLAEVPDEGRYMVLTVPEPAWSSR